MVRCTYAASWPTNTKCASGRNEGVSRKRRKDGAPTVEDRYPAGEHSLNVSRCLTRDLSTAPVDGAHAEAEDRAGLATVIVTKELFIEVVELVAKIPFSKVEGSLATSFQLILSAENRPILASRRDIAAIQSERN